MRLLVTGGAGFIGSHFARLALERLPEARVVVVDALTYAGNLSTLEDLRSHPRFAFYPGKIQDPTVVDGVIEAEGITHIVNFAAESHNDRSMLEPGGFLQTNVYGVFILLEAMRKHRLQKMVQVSTDEVYGTIDDGDFTEQSRIEPNTPYSASKAAGDLQVRAHVKAFGVPTVVTRGGNTYGPYQYPEKLIPFFVTRLIEGKKVPLYGEGDQIREWIHARDHAAGVLTALLNGEPGEIYNIGDVNERQNREVVKILLEETGRDEFSVKKIPDPRGASHDRRYSMSAEKIRRLGWSPQMPFEEELRKTVRWYVEHQEWWRPIVARPDFQEFVARFYGPTMGEDL